jgi:hypothetical protein
VTISLDAKSAALYGSHEKIEKTGNMQTHQLSELTIALYEREMTFTVEGDLNDEEKRDIDKTLKTLDRMLDNFVNGRLTPMLAKAKSLQGLDSISSLKATLSYEQTAIMAEQSQINTIFDNSPAGAELSPDKTVQMQNNESVSQLMEKADALANDMAETAISVQPPLTRMYSLTNQLLDDYRNQLKNFYPLGGEIIDRISNQFHNRLLESNGINIKNI